MHSAMNNHHLPGSSSRHRNSSTSCRPANPVDWRSNPGSYGWGFIELQFDVSAEGKAVNIVVNRSSPPMAMDALYARRLAESRFRPRLADGEPAPTASVSYRHDFRYPVSD